MITKIFAFFQLSGEVSTDRDINERWFARLVRVCVKGESGRRDELKIAR
jgi:hypothetical protein